MALDLATDPVWAAALAAPPCPEGEVPLDVLEGLDEDIADMLAGRAHMYTPGEVRAELAALDHDAAE